MQFSRTALGGFPLPGACTQGGKKDQPAVVFGGLGQAEFVSRVLEEFSCELVCVGLPDRATVIAVTHTKEHGSIRLLLHPT